MAWALDPRRDKRLPASATDEPSVVPFGLVDRLPSLELPARQVHASGPHHSDASPVAVYRHRLVANGTQPNGGNKAPLRRLAIAWNTNAPARAGGHLGSVYS